MVLTLTPPGGNQLTLASVSSSSITAVILSGQGSSSEIDQSENAFGKNLSVSIRMSGVF